MCTQTVYMTPVIYGSNSISPIFLQEDFCLHLHKHVYSISQQDYRAFVMTRMYDFTLGNGYPCILHGGDCAFRVSLYNGDSRRNGTLLCYKDVAFIVWSIVLQCQAYVTLLKSLYEMEVWMDILSLFLLVMIYQQYSDLITLENMKEDKEQPPCWRTRIYSSFHDILEEWKDILLKSCSVWKFSLCNEWMNSHVIY